MEKKNTVLLTIIAVATLLVAIVGATFAYFSATITETDKTETQLQAAELGITFDGTQEIVAESIEPGWSANKKFTVENTSNYDMTYDINLTRVVNNFQYTSDLTVSGTAQYVQGSNNKTYGTTADFGTTGATVKMVAIDSATVSGTQYEFALPTSTGQDTGKFTLPVDGTVDTSTTPATITYGANVTKVARVFIPAHAKEEITLTFAYKYKAPSTHEVGGEQVPYAIGDPADPSNQNADQGKIFRTTVAITANGIDSGSGNNTNSHTGSTTNGEYPTDSQTPVTP